MRVRAARLKAHGQPLVVEEVELAAPGEGEVLVDMAYAGVNPVDRYQAEGRVAPDAPVPRTLGSEGAGLVEGTPVMVRGNGLGKERDGLWATAAVVPERALIPVPEGVSLQQAAAMGVAGVTAWRCATEKAALTGQDRVLVLGASGGVGSILVSIARAAGATVWGQTGAREKANWIRERGAERVVVGDATEVAAAGRELQPTVVFDPLGDGFFGAAVEIMAEKGRLVAFGTSAGPRGEVPLQALYRKGLTVNGYGGLIESDEALA
ncbi:MAG TPA: zinc-binding alcohol dehydrogenase family protein, partial [Acidimicrobiales bacterium]|nr:zinc-binding alcohol dehydrogenase family protein [Acidimicrobiales bacterium]